MLIYYNLKKTLTPFVDLNTSYVNVNLYLLPSKLHSCLYLNTSYVNVNPIK